MMSKLRAQSMEFSELNVEYGFAYDSARRAGRQPAARERRRHPRLRAVDAAGRAARLDRRRLTATARSGPW